MIEKSEKVSCNKDKIKEEHAMIIDEVKVYIASTKPLEDEEVFRHFYGTVSEKRRKKIDRYRYPKDKRLSLAAEVLLKKALEQNGIPAYEVEQDENGKPYLCGNSSVKFNLSHSEERVMCVISNREVGCDVEKVRETDCKLAKRFFTDTECEWIDGAGEESGGSDVLSEKGNRFFRLWTLKESFIKAVGLGMRLSLKEFSFHIEQGSVRIEQSVNQEQYFCKEYDLNDGYRYAACGMIPEFGDVIEIILAES